MEEMYRLFVPNIEEPDIEGLIAYSLYKREKIDFIDNKTPSSEELQTFVNACGLPMQINRYKEQAQQVLAATIDDAIDEVMDELNSVKISPLGENYFSESYLDEKFPSKKRTVWWNIQGTFWFYVILALLLIVIQVIWSDKYHSIGEMLKMWLT